MPDSATVFQAELIGIKAGCEFFFDNPDHKPRYVKIISDSQDTEEIVSNLAWIAKKVTLAWTKAHVGTEGNEAADHTAKQAAHNDTNEISVPLPFFC